MVKGISVITFKDGTVISLTGKKENREFFGNFEGVTHGKGTFCIKGKKYKFSEVERHRPVSFEHQDRIMKFFTKKEYKEFQKLREKDWEREWKEERRQKYLELKKEFEVV